MLSPLNANEECQTRTQPINVIFFRPDGNNVSFWKTTGKFADTVAESLGIELQTIPVPEGENEKTAFRQLVQRTLNKNSAPDFIMSILYGGSELSEIEVFNQFAIPFFTLNTSFDDKVLGLIGKPREKFKNWIGHISPDEYLAGYQLMADLLSDSSNSTIGLIGGSSRSIVNTHRTKGAVTKALETEVNLIPSISTDWSVRNSKEATTTLLGRVSKVDILWTAGPDIALGALEAIGGRNKKVKIGSFDWSPSNIELVNQGKIAFSYGGHFTESGWALLMIYDYLHGLDFADELNTLVSTPLRRLDANNVAEISRLIAPENWKKIDYKKYSKCENKSLTNYDFRLKL